MQSEKILLEQKITIELLNKQLISNGEQLGIIHKQVETNIQQTDTINGFNKFLVGELSYMVEELKQLTNLVYDKNDYKIAVFIVNYNMPEKADALYEHLKKYEIWPMDIYLIDNGSDLTKPSKYTNVFIKKNIQTCRGWLKGLEEAKKNKRKYFAYMFLITSTNFISETPIITPMIDFLIKHPNAVGIHPSLSKSSSTGWDYLINRGLNHPRKTWMIDNIASIYRADWFDTIGWFDKDQIYAWGIDLETGYLARKQSRDIFIDERVQVTKITNIGYKMKRMNMKSKDRAVMADKNMREVFKRKYGEDYEEIIFRRYRTNEMD